MLPMKTFIPLLLLPLSSSFTLIRFQLPGVITLVNKCPRITTATSLASSISPSSESPRTLIRKGMQSFRDGDISSSLMYFDRADESDVSLRPYLWQRGISYYYLDQFRQGSDQVNTLLHLLCKLCTTFTLAHFVYITVSIGCIGESTGCRRNCRKNCSMPSSL